MKWNFSSVVNIKLFQQRSPKSMVEESSLQSQPGGGWEQRKKCSSRDRDQGRSPLKNHRDREEEGHRRVGGRLKSCAVTGYLREWINHGSHRGFIPGANIIKVQHSLDSPGLHPPHDCLGMAAEQCCGFTCSETGEKTKPPSNCTPEQDTNCNFAKCLLKGSCTSIFPPPKN